MERCKPVTQEDYDNGQPLSEYLAQRSESTLRKELWRANARVRYRRWRKLFLRIAREQRAFDRQLRTTTSCSAAQLFALRHALLNRKEANL